MEKNSGPGSEPEAAVGGHKKKTCLCLLEALRGSSTLGAPSTPRTPTLDSYHHSHLKKNSSVPQRKEAPERKEVLKKWTGHVKGMQSQHEGAPAGHILNNLNILKRH